MNFVLDKERSIAIVPVIEQGVVEWLSQQPTRIQNWSKSTHFKARPGQPGLFCNAEGELEKVFIGIRDIKDLDSIASLPAKLPEAVYHMDQLPQGLTHSAIAYAWGLGCYQFSLYRKHEPVQAKLFWPEGAEQLESIKNLLKSVYLIRDLINTSAEDMTPADIGEAVEQLASDFGGDIKQIIGDQLLSENFPAVHTVGRASVHQPRLIELKWGKAEHPEIVIIGKGVSFDSGGLDIKSASGMRLMKKDMSGSAHAIGLARLIMAENLPVRLRLIIPAVENAVSGDSYRPGDVIRMRTGKSVEVSNTDAEGRLILADALAYACESKPEFIVDFASLTGAAFVALGNQIAAMYTHADAVAEGITKHSQDLADPVWRMPLFNAYRSFLDSKVADLQNASGTPYAGSITAALFLNEFVEKGTDWVHFDMMSWSLKDRPGHPQGGDAMAFRSVFHYLAERFAV